MSTPYANLLTVELPGRWDWRHIATTTNEDGEGNIHAVIHTTVTAFDAEQAEARSLSVMDYDFEDDLRGAVAEASGNVGDTWRVDITLRPYR